MSPAIHVVRRSRKFWIAFSLFTAICALGSLSAIAVNLLDVRAVPLPGAVETIAMLAFSILFLSPLLTMAFLLAAFAAPGVDFRRYLFIAAGIECAASLYLLYRWFLPLFFH